jgi:hypothetical protein
MLISVSRVKQHTWFLLAIGSARMFHTFIVAGCGRRPEAFDLHLKFVDVYVDRNVMDCLKKVQEDPNLGYPNFGNLRCLNLDWSLVSTFFPGKLRPEEKTYWMGARNKVAQRKAQLDTAKNAQDATPVAARAAVVQLEATGEVSRRAAIAAGKTKKIVHNGTPLDYEERVRSRRHESGPAMIQEK